MQPGDVYQTNADTTKLEAECGYKPHWSLHDGIAEFMKWYKIDKNPLRLGCCWMRDPRCPRGR